MSKFVIVTFTDEKKAGEGVQALKDLHDEGSVSLYSYAVVQRDPAGRFSVHEAEDEGPIGTGVGALVGFLTGMVAGPAGAAVGLTIGTTVGASHDLFNLGLGHDFVASAYKQLAPGSTAVIAELLEDWVTPLDTRMEALGGSVLRHWREDFIDDEAQKRIDRHTAEVDQRRVELAAAKAERLEAMKKEVSKAEQGLRSVLDKVRTRLDRFNAEAEAKISALQEQVKKSGADAKARIEKRIAEVRADHAKRKAKLDEASKVAQEALRP